MLRYAGLFRFTECLLAAILIVLASPLLMVLMIIIRLDSRGASIFKQVRVGRGGRQFVCYKLRTMSEGAPNAATHLVPRTYVSRVGAFLRATRLDELPQLFNVLLGQMRFIGPRPCLPSQKFLVEQRRLLGVLEQEPGITGLAQVAGIDMSTPEYLAKVDAYYVQNRNLELDLRILFSTITRRPLKLDIVRPSRRILVEG